VDFQSNPRGRPREVAQLTKNAAYKCESIVRWCPVKGEQGRVKSLRTETFVTIKDTRFLKDNYSMVGVERYRERL